MSRRVLLVAVVLAAVLLMAAPAALAFNGYRDDYTPTATCAGCHTSGPGPAIYNDWAGTKHAQSNGENQSTFLPTSDCAGCHTANFDPSKAVPTPTATSSTGAVTWAIANGVPPSASPLPASTVPTSTVDYAASEGNVGCSSCHYNQTSAHAAAGANPADLANAQICGQCHSRFAYSVSTYTIAPIPYLTVANGSPVPNPKPITLSQPEYAIGFQAMGNSGNAWTPADLSTLLNIPSPTWTPAPNPAAASTTMKYWQIDGKNTIWQYSGHEGDAAQYPAWAGTAHANALKNLKAVMGPNPPQSCLQCHSADYIIAPADEKPTGDKAQYGLTCVVCHDPHVKGNSVGVWDTNLTPQLRADSGSDLCVQCHTAQLNGKVAKPGAEIHNTTKEVMNGTGAIGVPQGSPSVHRGKCVQCHMVPTSYGYGGLQLGGNHTFAIIEPSEAAAVSPMPVATPSPGVTTLGTMPFSACSTCHSRPGDQDAVWLQATINDRQAAMHAWSDQVTAALTKAAKKWGYKDPETANVGLNKKPMKKWTSKQMSFQKAYTNQEYVASEGSWGIHNWEYARAVILRALEYARAAN